MKTKNTHITIDCHKWRTGKNGEFSSGVGATELENNAGYRCCLGFVADHYKITDIKHRGSPSDIPPSKRTPTFAKLFITEDAPYQRYMNSELACQAIRINDNIILSRTERVKQLRALFKKHNITLHFRHLRDFLAPESSIR